MKGSCSLPEGASEPRSCAAANRQCSLCGAIRRQATQGQSPEATRRLPRHPSLPQTCWDHRPQDICFPREADPLYSYILPLKGDRVSRHLPHYRDLSPHNVRNIPRHQASLKEAREDNLSCWEANGNTRCEPQAQPARYDPCVRGAPSSQSPPHHSGRRLYPCNGYACICRNGTRSPSPDRRSSHRKARRAPACRCGS